MLQGLTGGTLLSRDKESIVFYRGKDFLPPAVSLAIEKRRKWGNSTIYEPKPNTEDSTLAQDASALKVSSDVSVQIHEEETSVSENRAESLNTVAQNVETRLCQVCFQQWYLVIFYACCLTRHTCNYFSGHSREREG
jgi:hypothetical protein